MAMGDVIGRLSVVLGLDTAAFETGARRAAKTTNDAGSRMEALGQRVGVAAKALVGLSTAIVGSQLIGQIKDMAIAGLEHASSLGEQAQQLGVTTSELQRYRFIATQVGIDQDVMDKGLSKLSITLGKLAQGAKAPAEALKHLGFSQQEIAQISQMTAGQAIPVLADAFAKMKSPTEAAALSTEFFGAKMGGKFMTLLMGGKSGIDQLTQAYQKLGIEISEGQIAKADDGMDKFGALQEVIKAKQAQIASDNVDGILRGTAAWENMKVAALVALGDIIKKHGELQSKVDELSKRFPDPWEMHTANMRASFLEMKAQFLGLKANFYMANAVISKVVADSIKYAQDLFNGVKVWVLDKLSAVWKTVNDQIETVKQSFFHLYDAVVGHSYVPDMVDGIAAQMARLDDVMVNPASKGTARTKAAFEHLQNDVRGIMGRLFPEAQALADLMAQRERLGQAWLKGGVGGFSSDQLVEAQRRLLAQADPSQRERLGAVWVADTMGQNDPLGKSMEAMKARIEKLSQAIEPVKIKAVEATRNIRASFADMAMGIVDSMDRAVGAFRNGNFVDKLRAVLEIILQIKGVVDALKKGSSSGGSGAPTSAGLSIPHYANGTSWHPGGLAMVGERGPELVNLPRGAGVVSNRALGQRGGGNVYNFSGNLMTPEFWAQIQQGDHAAAMAGAHAGRQITAYRQSRRLA